MSQVVAGGGLKRDIYHGSATRAQRGSTAVSLWRAEDLLRWAVAVGLGGVVVAVSWYVCAGEVSFSQQVGPTDVAVAGLLVAGIGNVGWLLKGRRALGERRRALLPDVPLANRDQLDVVRIVPRPADLDLYVGGDGMERFHRPECMLTSGRHDWKGMSRAEHQAAGRQPCGVCRP